MGKRKRKLTQHHIVNRHRGGTDEVENILMLWGKKHERWHQIFGNKNLKEAAYLLLRADKMKRR